MKFVRVSLHIPFLSAVLYTFTLNFLSLAVQAAGIDASVPSFHAYTLSSVPAYFDSGSFVSSEQGDGFFPLSALGVSAPVVLSKQELQGVAIVADHLRADIGAVSGTAPEVVQGAIPDNAPYIVVVGTLEHSDLIQQLIASGKLQVDDLSGKWEASVTQVVEAPFSGVRQALVIVGSDKRGAIYGMFDLSRKIGVSPWYWWADVPVRHADNLYIKPGSYRMESPKVQYRGIFINDEAPALSGWVYEKFGEFNKDFYEKVYELILRLRGNYLWPAMWGRSLFDDDSQSDDLADVYGIVLGTSHHEPLMRAHVEWQRYGSGPWDYSKNAQVLSRFWREGVERMGAKESIVTIGMRGDGDEPMSEESNIALLEQIVADQRDIIADVTGEPAEKTPQMWALYKEVQDYYDKGMRVPDDVTLLLCDDNWGNIRKLPPVDAQARSGGYGIYYHFDYVGGPRNYKWINTVQISRVWEQMHLAYEHNVRKLWIVNVGDIKPMEYPISFFLDYAWNPDAIQAKDLPAYAERWAAEQFGETLAAPVAHMLTEYTRFNSRRKPEMLNAKTYALKEGREWNRVENDYKALQREAESVSAQLPSPDFADAYYQLISYPVMAGSNLNEMYAAVARNRFFAKRGMLEANAQADRVKTAFAKDADLSEAYHSMKQGKWHHMMAQTHIGYINWQEPEAQVCPEVAYVDESGTSADNVATCVEQPVTLPITEIQTGVFIEQNGFITMEAPHFSRKIEAKGQRWLVVPDLGRTGSAVTITPVTVASQLPGEDSSRLQYRVYLNEPGTVTVNVYVSPTLDYEDRGGLRYAVSFDGETPQVVNIHDESFGNWDQWVGENIIKPRSVHHLSDSGVHTLNIWSVDPGVVFQKIVIETGEPTDTYLGPQESPISQ
ncbi:MAG: glycosyl hydrolase 115 family protein [Opitutales bacterium]|nr:glycosyl hydrolase 115 family protein [Opitutales bacterium]